MAIPTLYFPKLTVLAVQYVLLAQIALAATFYGAARRAFHPALAVFVAFLVMTSQTTRLPTTLALLPAAVFIWCVDRVEDPSRRRLNLVFAATAGALAGLEFLVSFYTGLVVLALGAATVLLVSGGCARNLAAFGGSFLAGGLVLWLLAGNPFGALGPFLENSFEIVSGYSTAMGREDAGRWELIAAVVAVAALVALARSDTRSLPRRTRLGILVLGALLVFPSFKHSFVRHDVHSSDFFAVVFGAALAFVRHSSPRALRAFALLTLFTAFLAVARPGISSFDPWRKAKVAVEQAQALATDRRATVKEGRSRLRGLYGVDRDTRRLLAGHTVHIAPVASGVAWTYPKLVWDPLPVFQSYSAYTAELDDLNASFLRSADAPERILRSPRPAIDGRQTALESPAANLAMLCRYVQVRATGRWQVLARRSDRCGPAEPMATVRADSEEPVRVPAGAANDVLFMVVHGVARSPLDRLRAFAYKLGAWRIVVNGESFRLVPDTATNPMLVSVPRAADYTPVYRLSPDMRTVAVHAPPGQFPSTHLTFDFFRMPISGPGVDRSAR